jgi:hypothetical protein
VAIEDWAVSSLDLSRVVEDNDLSLELISFFGGVILGVTTDVTSSNILDRDVLNVESDVVSWECLLESFVMHFN